MLYVTQPNFNKIRLKGQMKQAWCRRKPPLSKKVAVEASKTVKKERSGVGNVVLLDLDLFCLF